MPGRRKATPILWRWWMSLSDLSSNATLEEQNQQNTNKDNKNNSNGSDKRNNKERNTANGNTSNHEHISDKASDNKEASEGSKNNEEERGVTNSENSDNPSSKPGSESSSESNEGRQSNTNDEFSISTELVKGLLDSGIINYISLILKFGKSSLSSLRGGVWNSKEVVKLLNEELGITSKVKMEFNRFIDVFAEYENNIISYNGYNTYHIKKLLLRKYEGKPPSHYKVSREKEKLVLIIDNSGSMGQWTYVLLVLTRLARMRRDVEIYTAPNGEIKSKWDERKKRWVPANSRDIYKLRGRKILYIGDFDGANLPVELSRKNTVVYICTEDRYRYFTDHDWVYYDEEDFKGFFIRAWTIEEIIEGLKMIIKPNASKWIDFHEDHCYEGDECYNYEYEFEDDDSYDDDEDYYYDDDYDYSNNDDEDEYYYDDDE